MLKKNISLFSEFNISNALIGSDDLESLFIDDCFSGPNRTKGI